MKTNTKIIQFNLGYFVAFLLLLLTEILIAIYIKQGFIRYTFGDFLSTILVYCFIRSFLIIKPLQTAILTLIIAYGIEFLQLINILELLDIKNKIVRIVFGTSFSIEDLVAYTLGVATIYLIDTFKYSS